jgi:class 3 adenylate cyclase/tetratricopeptide (TPR) repeat protein
LVCAICGTENEAGRKFCGECGSRLAVVCSSCGTPNAPSAKFCGECGAATQAALETVPAEPAELTVPPIAERRLVSVLFADLVGFTSLSESRDAEEVRELLTRYFDTCRALVNRYGGVVEKFIGDAVMAVWGTPVTNEDDAERAVRAALDLVSAVAALGEEAGVATLRARAGVLSGEAAVTIGATDQGMVAGDLVNTASRIQSAAKPGQVLVGAETKMATERAIEYEEAGSHELKGKAAPIPLWRALRVVALTGGTVRSGEIEPPFTGRDAELRLIKELFHTSADEKRAHLVSMMGIGGIGKSRLAWEFEKYLDGLAAEVWWQRGRCLAYGDGVAFWALAEMVRTRAGIVEDEESEEASPKLRALLDRIVPDEEERRFVEPRLAQLLGLEARGPGDQENLFSAWRIFFERLADDSPTVLLFEDLHWADASLLDFIEYLLDWGRDRPIFIMTLARPELLEGRPTWGAARRGFTSMFLEPLASEHIEVLLEGAVEGLPAELRAQILARSEGIPFYAVETVRMLMDRGLLVREKGGFRATGPIEQLEVPSTLHALIAARLDGLEPDERRILQDASVLGRTFTVAGLEAVSGLDRAQLEPILGALVRKEIVSMTIDPMSPERGQYGFLQDLVKRVAYDTMSKRDRRPRHLAAAEHLTAIGGPDDEDVVEVIAAHLLDAYEAVPDAPDASEVRARARDAQVRAGERAASLGANLAAQRYFERAASLADEPSTQAELLERAGQMAGSGARTQDALELYGRSLQLFGELGAAHPAARVSARHAELMWDQGRMREGLDSMDAAFRLLTGDPPDADLASLAAQIGRFAFFAGDGQLGLERVETALAIAESLDLPEVLSQALNTKALILGSRGREHESRALMRYSLDVALEHDKPSAALRAYNNLADFLMQDDRFADAQRTVDQGLLLARRAGNRYWEQIFLGVIYPHYALGEWSAALGAMEELGGWDEHTQARTAFTQGSVAFGVAIHANRGELADAERIVTVFRDLADSPDSQERAEYAAARAFAAMAAGDHRAALEAATTACASGPDLGAADFRVKEAQVVAVEAAMALGDVALATKLLGELTGDNAGQRRHFLVAHAMRLKAALATAGGEDAGVEDGLKGAIGLFRELSYPYWTARSLLEQGDWLMSRGRVDEAEASLAESRAILEALGAMPWLERVDAARGATSSPAA